MRIACALILLATGLTTVSQGQNLEDDPTTGLAEVRQKLAAGGWSSVIVKLKVPDYRPEGLIGGSEQRQLQRTRIQNRQSSLLAGLDNQHLRVKRQYKLIPYVAVEVSEAGLTALEASPLVELVTADLVGEPSAIAGPAAPWPHESAPLSPAPTAESRLVVGADVANANGCDGSGWAIAMLDSGIQNDHPAYVGRVTHEACFSTHSPGLDQESLCPNFATDTTGTGVGDDCIPCISRTGTDPNYVYNPPDCDFWPPGQVTCPHGTLVTGPAAGNGGGVVGIAPSADIVSILVMTRYTGAAAPSPWDRGRPLVNLSDLMAGIEHVALLSDSVNIAALNISIDITSTPGQPGRQTAPCDGIAALSGVKDAVDVTNSYGIPTTASTGNDDWRDRINPPACLSNVISVAYTQDGSTYMSMTTKVDSIGREPNRASFLDFWAPGEWITGGWPHNAGQTTLTTRGTSLAAPQVAAAFAALRSKGGTRGIDYYRMLLDSTGVMVTDNKLNFKPLPEGISGITKPRIDVGAACLAMSVVEVDAKALLEGPYLSGGMMSIGGILQDSLPLTQPFGGPDFAGTVLEHAGVDAVPNLPSDVVDWVMVSLRSGTAASTQVTERPALLLTDGSIVDFDGSSPVRFLGVDSTSYYLVVRHRNHGDVMSSSAINLSGGSGSWDFTTGMSQAYTLDPDPMKLLDSRYVMFGGDIDIDAQITAADFNEWLTQTKAVAEGYQSGDITLDGQVTSSDFNIWLVNTKAVLSSQVPN
jgi:hypothetical protein